MEDPSSVRISRLPAGCHRHQPRSDAVVHPGHSVHFGNKIIFWIKYLTTFFYFSASYKTLFSNEMSLYNDLYRKRLKIY